MQAFRFPLTDDPEGEEFIEIDEDGVRLIVSTLQDVEFDHDVFGRAITIYSTARRIIRAAVAEEEPAQLPPPRGHAPARAADPKPTPRTATRPCRECERPVPNVSAKGRRPLCAACRAAPLKTAVNGAAAP